MRKVEGQFGLFFHDDGSGPGKSPGTWLFYLDENQCKDVCRTRVAAVVRHNDVIEVYGEIRFQSKTVLLWLRFIFVDSSLAHVTTDDDG